MITVFDTETTGLPKNYKAPAYDLDNWPRLVQLAWSIYDYDGKTLVENEFIIKPEGFEIPVAASKVHGITTERALKEGIPLKKALEFFSKALSKTDYLVAHNISFDEKIIDAEFIRTNLKTNLNSLNKICTKEASTEYCKLPGKYGYKWPNLTELYNILFNRDFDGAHNALADVRACARCFFELVKLQEIELVSYEIEN